MRNPALEALDALVGEWDLTLTHAWFLESMEVEQHGHAVGRWLGDAFLELTAEIGGEHAWHFVGDPHNSLAWFAQSRPSRVHSSRGRSDVRDRRLAARTESGPGGHRE